MRTRYFDHPFLSVLAVALAVMSAGCAPLEVNPRYPSPSVVSGIEGVTAITAGYRVTTALRSDGTVWAWGANDAGQLGDGTKRDRNTPGQVSGLRDVVAIGDSHALKNDGTVWAWGKNTGGDLGDGTTIDRTTPVQVLALGGDTKLSGIVRLQGGLAFSADGTAWIWGSNGSGAFGDGGPTGRLTAVPADSLPRGMTAVALGSHSLAVTADGSVWSWGSNLRGELCRRTDEITRVRPLVVAQLGDAVSVAIGSDHGLVLKRDGTVWACGKGQEGQLGDGERKTSFSPVQAKGISGVIAVDAGSSHSLALDRYGVVWSWGLNFRGQLGDGSLTQRDVPVRIPGLPSVANIAAGADHSVALAQDGKVWIWGSMKG